MTPPTHASLSAQEKADALGLPWNTVANPVLVTYRSVGIGIFGACMRLAGMPLEKIALYMNSAQVTPGKGQLAQAVRLTFQEGALAPYRVVGPSSLTAWFLQYSVMGIAFQFFDHSISNALGVEPVAYGKQLMEECSLPTTKNNDSNTASYQARWMVARMASPLMAATLESLVSNRAEVQRFFGPTQYAKLRLTTPLARMAGPALLPNVTRNFIMCQTSFLLTPLTYKLYFPQEHKSVSSLFWYGLGLNIFVGNVAAITQQALWGRSLDFLRSHGVVDYTATIRHGLATQGTAAFWTAPKWFSRVLMNAPAQGTLPWFYNEVLPLGEMAVLQAVQTLLVRSTVTSTTTTGKSTGRIVHRVTTVKPSLSRSNSTFGATSPR